MNSAGYHHSTLQNCGDIVNTNNHNSSSSPQLDRQTPGLWNTSLSSSDSSGSWAQGILPPPPQEYNELSIKPSSVPFGPAKPWDSEQSDDDDSTDEGWAVSIGCLAMIHTCNTNTIRYAHLTLIKNTILSLALDLGIINFCHQIHIFCTSLIYCQV